MGRNTNPFKGVNKVCAQCVKEECKQFENVILINCPRFQSKKTQNPLSSSFEKRPRMRNKVGKN